MKTSDQSPLTPDENTRQHLGFIQAAIGRMSSGSAVAKGWALTISTAAYGYAGTKDSMLVAALGVFAVLLFTHIDVMYLREEKRYRELYNAVRTGVVTHFEMNAATHCKALPRKERSQVSYWRAVRSWSVWVFYGAILVVGAALILWLRCRS